MADEYGIKVSKAGYDVKIAGIADQIFNSEKNCIKLSQKLGTVSSVLASGGGSETHQIAHGFSFTPGFLVWFEIDNSGDWLFMYIAGGFNDYVNCIPFSDATYLQIPLINNGSNQHTVVAYYVILADKGG